MPRKSDKPRKSIWDNDNRPYGVNKGARGTPAQWKQSYEDRMNAGEAQDIFDAQGVESDGEWAVLGVPVDSPWDVVKKAYRALVMANCVEALGTNLDPVAEALFKKYRAAYSLIADRHGIKA